MRKRALSLLLSFLMLFSIFPTYGVASEKKPKEVTIWHFNSELEVLEEDENISITQDGKMHLSAAVEEGISGSFQWQIEAEKNTWVDIQGSTDKELNVTYSLIKNVLRNNKAQVRCAVVTDEEEFYSNPVTIFVIDETSAQNNPESKNVQSEAVAYNLRSAPQDAAANRPSVRGTTLYTITIEYVHAETSKFAGQRVSLPYIAEVAEGGSLTGTITSPSCVGYVPDMEKVELNFDSVTEDVKYVVEYSPDIVSYTVRHYQQNTNDDEYTWVDTTVATGKTEELTSDSAANTYVGFTALSHYHEEIAADSSTTIDIYYDRDYHLITFDLDGGYGTAAVYARYGADVFVSDPQKAGYSFKFWTADGKTAATIPAIMPAENRSYTAVWTPESVPFTVAYWLEDPNVAGTYHYWTSAPQNAVAGSSVDGEKYKNYADYVDVGSLDKYERRYSEYSHADANVTVKGDGTTVVNVYYNRKTYTLKFYYAMSSGSDSNTAYYVIGGSTYYFGTYASTSNKGNEVSLLDQYMSTYSSQRGRVDKLPSLNEKGLGRNYTTGYDTSTVSNVAYKYYYISFSAKYGADTSSLWPCDVFSSVTRTSSNTHQYWRGTEAFVSAWNGEHHVFYSQKNGNQTIKGNYNELDHQLLWDYDTYGDTDTVSYLCFWENGADIYWSVPELYVYNIWVQNVSGSGYTLLRTYNTVDDSDVNNQTAPANSGFTYTHMTSRSITNPNSSLYSEAWEVNFYYSRDQYNLTFVNGGATSETEKVYYEADLSGFSSVSSSLTYHDPQQAAYYRFADWYTTPDAIPGTRFELNGANMPGSAVTLYAHWELISHNVGVYLTEEDAIAGTNQVGQTTQVTHAALVPENLRPDETTLKNKDDPDATFVGWFYKDEKGNEQAFSFATMTINQNMTIYAKWRSNLMKEVIIKYMVEEEIDGEVVYTQIADTETLVLRMGQTRTFDAKTGYSLYEDYRYSCFPLLATRSITPTIDDIKNTEPIVYTFVYKKYGSVPYRVEFYVQQNTDADGDGVLDLRPAYKIDQNGNAVFVTAEEYEKNPSYTAYSEDHPMNDKAVVTELYVPDNMADNSWTLPDAYFPNALKTQRIIIPGENNEYNEANTIQFIYSYEVPEPGEEGKPPVYKARYLVQHFIQNASDTSSYELHSYNDVLGLSGETAYATPMTIPGYTYSYEVTNEKKQNGTALTQGTSGATSVMSGIINADDSLELNFYYTIKSYPYQVMFLEEGTNRILKETKTVTEDGKLLAAPYGVKVTERAAEIDGYNISGNSEKSIYIQMEAGDEANVNTIIFYYTRKNADLTISKVVDTKELDKNGEKATVPDFVYDLNFTFVITCPAGFHKSSYDYTLTEPNGETSTGKITASTTTLELLLKHGQSITIHELATGEYTVSEVYNPRFSVSANGVDRLLCDVVLEEDDQPASVAFVNYYISTLYLFPATGGTGFTALVAIGTVLIAAASFYLVTVLVKDKKKKKEKKK